MTSSNPHDEDENIKRGACHTPPLQIYKYVYLSLNILF